MKRFSRPLVLALVLTAAPAVAQDATTQARTLFNAGAQAYEAGQFAAALQAFGEAYRLSPRPGILFSMAQAHKKQFYVDKQPTHLHEAQRLYREYIAKVETGGRRVDAVQGLAEIEPLLERLGTTAPAAAPPPERKPPTRLMVSTQAKECAVLLDGKPIEAGLFADVHPGKHKLHITAAGYLPEDRDVEAAEGGVVALDVSLREQPGLLTVTTPDGAEISIDGRTAATAPLARPIEVSPGAHFVAVTRRGYRPFAQDLEIGRGEARALSAPLEVTNQRVASYVLIGVAAAGLVAAGVLTGIAYSEQSQAQTIDNRRASQGGLSLADLAQYNSYLGTRDDLRTAAGVAAGGAAVVGITGVFLAIFDVPSVSSLSAGRRDDKPRPATPAPRERAVDVTASPILGPGFYGASLSARF